MDNYISKSYFSNCPNCGAPGNGSEYCGHCGASLVNNNVNKYFNGSQSNVPLQDQFAIQDAACPRIEGKSGERGFTETLFLTIFGFVFTLVGCVFLVLTAVIGSAMGIFVLLAVVFLIIGIVSLILLFKTSAARVRCRKGQRISGIVRGYEEIQNVTFNDAPLLKIKVLVDMYTNPRIIIFSIGSSVRTYEVGSQITLRNSGDYYIIEK